MCGMHVEDGVDDAADVARHPRRAERGGVGNRAAVVGANVEEPLRLRHVAVATRDLVFLADRAELSFLRRAGLNRTREPRLEEEFLSEQRRAGESRYLLVVSTGRAGSGESVLRSAQSWGEKPSPPGLPAREMDWHWRGRRPCHRSTRLTFANAAAPSSRTMNQLDFCIAHLGDEDG